MKIALTVLCVMGLGLGMAGCSQDAMDAVTPASQMTMTQATSTPSDGTTSLAAIAARPALFLNQTVVVRGRLNGWKAANPALTQDGAGQALPVLGDARHLAALFPQVDGSRPVEITGTIATNNTALTAAVGIVPKRMANI